MWAVATKTSLVARLMGHCACVLLIVKNEPLQGLSLGWNITLGGAVLLLKVLAPGRKAVVQTACLPLLRAQARLFRCSHKLAQGLVDLPAYQSL